MKILMTGGSGLIGTILRTSPILADWEWIVVSRHPRKTLSEEERTQFISYDTFFHQPHSFLEQIDAIVNLAGSSISSFPWTDRKKMTIYQSRIEITRQLIQLLQTFSGSTPPLFNASAVGVYGFSSNRQEAFSESSPLPETSSFIAQVARDWEAEALKYQKNRVILLRFGMVLSSLGGALPPLLKSVKWFTGSVLGTGEQPISWIAGDEIPLILKFLLTEKSIQGPVNLVAPEIVTQKEFIKSLGDFFHRPIWFRTPEWILKTFLGQFAEELLLQGQAVSPTVLQKNKYAFQISTLKQFLKREFLKSQNSQSEHKK